MLLLCEIFIETCYYLLESVPKVTFGAELPNQEVPAEIQSIEAYLWTYLSYTNHPEISFGNARPHLLNQQGKALHRTLCTLLILHLASLV